MTTIIKTIGKFNAVFFAALITTLCLFYSMQALIMSDLQVVTQSPTIKIGPIVIPEIEIIPVLKSVLPEKDKIPVPPLVEERTVETEGPRVSIFQEPPPVTLPKSDLDHGIGIVDGNAIALVKVQPSYPRGPLSRGTEGYVIIEFDVDVNGLVVNPRVLYSEPENIFDRAALKALERWKYNPKIVNGQAVKMYGVQQRMSFTIDD